MKHAVSWKRRLLGLFLRQCMRINRSWSCVVALFLTFFFVSCSSMPDVQEKSTKISKTTVNEKEVKNLRQPEPQPGDIKVIDDVEFIYASNRRYMFTPYEPLYVWIKKEEYTPRMGENLLTRNPEEEKHLRELEERIKRLEDELKKTGNS
jgi:hypothetical protein